MKQPKFSHFLWIFLCLHLISCNSGGIGDIAEGGIDGTGLGTGPISQFGSIFVNDIQYNTDNAKVIINNEISTVDQLQLGMYVDVIGPQNPETGQGTAQRIEYHDTLRGPISFISPAAPTLRVMSQIVRLTETTQRVGFKTLADLQVGDSLRVSGPATAGPVPGGIAATRIERLAAGSKDAFLIGMVINLNEDEQTFFASAAPVDFSQTPILPAELRESILVSIQGAPIPNEAGTIVVHAAQIEELTPEQLPAGSLAKIAGSVTRYENPQDFEVEYRRVSLASNLADTLTAPLRVGAQVRMSGTFDAQGIIIIEEIEVSERTGPGGGTPSSFLWRVGGVVNHMSDNLEQLNVSGVDALLTARTTYRDMSGANLDYGAMDIRTGDSVSIAMDVNPQGQFEVLRLNYEPFVRNELRQLLGDSSHVDPVNQQLHILGVPILTTAETRYFDASQLDDLQLPPLGIPFSPPEDAETDATTFFNQLEALPNHLVHAASSGQGDALSAQRVVLLPFVDVP